MTRKDFELIAAALRNSQPTGGQTEDLLVRIDQWHEDVSSMARTLSRDNPRFDQPAFLRNCGATS